MDFYILYDGECIHARKYGFVTNFPSNDQRYYDAVAKCSSNVYIRNDAYDVYDNFYQMIMQYC